MNPETRDAIKFCGTAIIGFGAFIFASIYFPAWAIWAMYFLALVLLGPTFLQADALLPYGLLAIIWLIAVLGGL